MELETGQGAWMPATPFELTITGPNEPATPLTAEIVTVETLSGDKVTVMKRAQYGTVARSVKVGDIADSGVYTPPVISYGADPTGILDSTQAFKKAAAAGQLMEIPEGTFNLNEATTSPIELGGKTLRAAGVGATKFTVNSTTANLFTVSSEQTTLEGFTIENLKHEPTSGAFIKITAPGAGWAKVTVQNVATLYAFNGIEVVEGSEGGMAGVNLTGIWQDYYKGSALLLGNGSNSVTLTNFWFQADAVTPEGFTPTGIRMESFTPGCTVQNGEVLFGVYGLHAQGTGEKIGEGPQASRFSNCYFDTQSGAGGAGNWLIDCEQIQFGNCWFSGSGEGGLIVKGCWAITLTGGEIYGNKTYGLLVTESVGTVKCLGTDFIANATGFEVASNTAHFMATECTWRENGWGVKVGTGCNIGTVNGVFEGNTIGNILNESGTATDLRLEDNFTVQSPTVTKTAGTLVTGQAGQVREVFVGYYAKKEKGLKKVKHSLGTEKATPKAWVWKEGKWQSFAITSYLAENLTELELEFTEEPYAEVAAKAPTSETKIGESKINMTGSEAAGFKNGRIVEFTLLPFTTSAPLEGTPYFIVGASANAFEISLTFGGTAVKVAGKALTAANAKVKVLAEEIQIAVTA